MKNLTKILLPVLIILSACKKTTEPDNVNLNDKAEIENLITQSDYFNALVGFSDWNVVETQGDTISNYLVRWGREIKNIIKDINIHIEGDSAVCEINKDVEGTLHILSVAPDTAFHLAKPLHHNFKRYAVFRKIEGKRWELEKISFGESKSVDTSTVIIDSIKVEIPSKGMVKVYKEPLNLFNKEEILEVNPFDSITITLYTSSQNVLAFLHPRPFARKILIPVSEGIFQGKFYAPPREGVHHAVFDLIRWESIMTESYPYEDSHLWFLVYRVKR